MALAVSQVEPSAESPEEISLPRVLYAVVMDPSQKYGSLEEQIAFLVRAFDEHGSLFLPLFICPDAPRTPTPLERHGVSIECLDLSRFRFKNLRRLLALIRNRCIDVVHWNFYTPLANSYLWWLTLLRPRLKHYLTDHNSRPVPLPAPTHGPRKLIKRLLLKRYAKVVCVSQFVFDCLDRDQTWSNLVCCRHFINTARFRPNEDMRFRLRKEQEVQDRFVLLTVAHLIPDKGVDVAVRALAELPEEAILWVIGEGPEAGSLRALAEGLKVSGRLRFHGPQRNVEPFMQAADCLLCPSMWAEAAGLANLEGQASGLPVIASRIGGIPEYVEHERTGYLFPRGDAKGLAACVRRLMADPALVRQFSRAAQDLVHLHFSPEARLRDMLALYQRSR
jgi:glycosyltransferase involved in cell wall biosynthesis